MLTPASGSQAVVVFSPFRYPRYICDKTKFSQFDSLEIGDMWRPAAVFVMLVLIGSAAFASEPKRPTESLHEPYEPMAASKFLDSLSTSDQATYFRGLLDSYLYFVQRGAAGEEMKKCFADNPPIGTAFGSSQTFRYFLEREKPEVSMTAFLQTLMQRNCEALSKLKGDN